MNKPASQNTQMPKNEFGQFIGEELSAWAKPKALQGLAEVNKLTGQYCELELLDNKHSEGLYKSFASAEDSLWTYLPYGPCNTEDELSSIIDTLNSEQRANNIAYAIFDKSGKLSDQPLGFSAYLRIQPNAGSIEIGHLAFSPLMQSTRVATEAIFLMIDMAFKLGYRRCEWKCNDLNEPSLSAAKRFGFSYEGTFRNALVVKGRNRDTAWFSIIDSEWPMLREAYLDWLAGNNFDSNGQQKTRLSKKIAELRTL